jgi:alpha-1,6-mannosyltransferase
MERSILKAKTNLIYAALLLLGGAGLMVPFGSLHEYGSIPWFLSGAGLMVAGYFCAIREKSIPAWLFWGVAVGARFLLLWQAPGDDIFRYVWEGRVLLEGFNPYKHSPDASVLEMLRGGTWEAVEYKTFTAIYPPLAEGIFALLSGILPVPVFFKFVFAVADLGIVALLVRAFGKPSALLYAWNPLVIYSFAGGGHYDCLFILAIVCGWLAWRTEHVLRASLWMGAAVAIKWIALPLVAWMVWQILRQRGCKAAFVAGCVSLLPFGAAWAAVGFWTGEWTAELLPPMFSEYARSAEFLPAIVGWFWEESKYANHLFVAPLALAWGVVIFRARSIERAAQWMFFLALIFTPMLHAWYFTWIIPFAAKTRNLGIIWLPASGFTYFLLYHHVESPGGMWRLTAWEAALLWLPFAAGFLWSEWRRLRKPTAQILT